MQKINEISGGDDMVFVGRQQELQALEKLYEKSEQSFQMAIVYGRRRIGKTSLISQFCEGKRAIIFTAREQTNMENLRDFSRVVYEFFNIPATTGAFADWGDALKFIAEQDDSSDQNPTLSPLIVVFDEFPYAAQADKSLSSTLQVAIDHVLKNSHIFMILCGSNEGFMESEVLGKKSPLYGRRTAQIRVKPFDLFEAAELMPSNASWEDKINYFAALGGTPYYLEQLDGNATFEENIEQLCFNISGILYAEPEMLMRQELREPSVYNSVLNALATGCNTLTLIADRIGLPATTINVYLKTLESLGLVERNIPFGYNPLHSKKGLWKIRDSFFAYWYQFVAPACGLIERGLSHAAVSHVHGGEHKAFTTFVGQQFERMCEQWIVRQCQLGKLDFLPTDLGKWWGTDPIAHEQTDIDIVAEDTIHQQLLVAECKWRNRFNETEAVHKLVQRAPLVRTKVNCDYDMRLMLFTKHPVSGRASGELARLQMMAVDAETMFFDK